ncbi:MAG TPA: phosphotransferase family protein [Myxococcota bacterium]|nr:phosphotransferase family protein [Myxococcota bacterium]
MQELEPRIAAYAAHRMPDATDVRVAAVERIHGGASRETFRFRLHWREGARELERRLILRRDPPGSLIETDRAAEFAAYRAFRDSSVPVPEALWLESDSRWLDHPFFVMEEIVGCDASPQAIVAPPYAQHHDKLARQKWTILGQIAAADPEKLGLVGALPEVTPGNAWWHELDHWTRVIDEDELEPQPIIRAAIRRLRRAPPPPPARLHVVHGDYRTGNFLYDGEGDIRGILDWEMAHLGDPLEDLAWSINRIWCWARDGRVGGLTSKAEAIRIWESASGLRADPGALHWWELFSSVKGLAIWISGGREYQSGSNKDPVLAFSSIWLSNAQNRAALETLGKLS